jgi:hypothetical protein
MVRPKIGQNLSLEETLYDYIYLIARDVYNGMSENFRIIVKKNNRHLALFNAIANAPEPCLVM